MFKNDIKFNMQSPADVMSFFMKKIAVLVIMIILYPCFSYAQSVPPADNTDTMTLTLDLSSIKYLPTIRLYDHVTGAYDPINWRPEWAQSGWLCTDRENSANGICNAHDIVDSANSGDTLIKLLFTERRSHTQVYLQVEARNYSLFPIDCAETKSSNLYYMNDAGGVRCASSKALATGKELYAYLQATELSKLPFGGIWEATMVLEQRGMINPGHTVHLATWTKHIVLDITDEDHQQIYLPDFGDAQPLIDLNMHPLPGVDGRVNILHGENSLGLCLYDGFNSQSSQFTVQMKNQGPDSRAANLFSLYREGGSKTKDEDRIDFTVRMLDPTRNKYTNVKREEDIFFDNIQQAQTRLVHLSGIPEAVLCVPTPLKLETVDTTINKKNQGRYVGNLTFIFTEIF